MTRRLPQFACNIGTNLDKLGLEKLHRPVVLREPTIGATTDVFELT